MKKLNVHGKFRFYQPEFNEDGSMKRSEAGQALEEKRITAKRLKEVVKRTKQEGKVKKNKDGKKGNDKRSVVEVAELVLQGGEVTEEEAAELATTATALEQEVEGVDAPDEFKPDEVSFELNLVMHPSQDTAHGFLSVRPIIDTPYGKRTSVSQTIKTKLPEIVCDQIRDIIQNYLDTYGV